MKTRTSLKPGQTLPGAGRPKGCKDKFSPEKLRQAFNKAAKVKGMTIYEWLAQEAYTDSTLAVALLKKLMPDLRHTEITKKYEGGYSELSPADTVAAMMKATMGKKPIPPVPEERV